MRFPTGSEMPTLSPTRAVAQLMTMGMVKSVTTLLMAVSVTESATSPSANLEKTLEELPPGQHAIRTRPIKNTGSRRNDQARASAMAGRSTNWPNMATASGHGRENTFPKSSKRSESPRSNIRRVRMGSTIQMAITLS